MVLQNNVQMIITLCESVGASDPDRAYSASQPDCALYFPLDEPGKDCLQLSGYTVKIEKGSTKPTAHMVTRKFALVRNSDGQVMIQTEHYHFTSWTDHEAPQDESMESFIKLVKKGATYVGDSFGSLSAPEQARQEPKRLLVHCRAGVGRTGTTIAAVNMLLQLKKQRQDLRKTNYKFA